MLVQALEIFHIAVLGYWLGSELVINSTYRFTAYAAAMPFPERKKLMDHVMNVDQHVRYALVLQATGGTALAALYGYIPGGVSVAAGAGVTAVVWLALVEVAHRIRHGGAGQGIALFDRVVRYAVLVAFAGTGGLAIFGPLALDGWLAWKLILFAGVIACGVGIRLSIIGFFDIWREIDAQGSTEEREKGLRRIYVESTSILGLLWVFIFGIVILSVFKPL